MTIHERTPAQLTAPWPSPARWAGACTAAEAIGMTAAAGAALLANGMGAATSDRWLALGVVVLGGLVEGIALGSLQALALRPVLGVRSRRWALVTVLVAGLGWALASAPGTLADPGSGTGSDNGPPWLLAVVGGALLGTVMGALLGAGQAATMGPGIRHRWRWVGISALAWTPAMAVIFVGATVPGDAWPAAAVLVVAPVTGAAAGFVLGRASGWLLPSLTGAKPHDLLVLWLLANPLVPWLHRRLLGLRFPGAVSGRVVELPVQYAVDGPRLVVMPAHAETKHWWHNLEWHLTEVHVLRDHHWSSAVAEVLTPGTTSYDSAAAAYTRRWGEVDMPEGQPFVLIYGLTTEGP
jgi:hypothetical protein